MIKNLRIYVFIVSESKNNEEFVLTEVRGESGLCSEASHIEKNSIVLHKYRPTTLTPL